VSIHDESFLRFMGQRHPYDGIQQHPYVISDPKRDKAGSGDAAIRLLQTTRVSFLAIRGHAGCRDGDLLCAAQLPDASEPVATDGLIGINSIG
jgi:hypothetical protein